LIEKFDKSRHNPAAVKDLLALALGHPTSEKLQKIPDEFYTQNGHTLFVASEKEKLTGVIGYDVTASPHGWIVHLAIHPDHRMRGIGRNLILETMKALALESVALETDQDAVNFYRACGFKVVEIRSKWPETHRYRCTKGQMPEFVLKYYDI
jgi:ribosomal protein S18 acetylase RimI-like enzyme